MVFLEASKLGIDGIGELQCLVDILFCVLHKDLFLLVTTTKSTK